MQTHNMRSQRTTHSHAHIQTEMECAKYTANDAIRSRYKIEM